MDSEAPGADNVSTIVRFPDGQGEYGHQLQRRTSGAGTGEGIVTVSYTETDFRFPDGEVVQLRQPQYRLFQPAHGPFPDRFTVLIAPKLAGVGLIEAIPEASIRAGADPSDRDNDGISGRVGMAGTGQLGRFGWRAEAWSVPDQVARALTLDMGLSSSAHPFPEGDCRDACGGDTKAEVSDTQFDAIVAFTRFLPAPPARSLGRQAKLGARLFAETGCAACHRPSFDIAAAAAPYPAPATIRPYSDLLLHDMGPGLGDPVSREWRTAPLWGATLRRTVQGNEFYLHDGRARQLVEAVLWHGGEAERAKAGFVSLSRAERKALLEFVGSL